MCAQPTPQETTAKRGLPPLKITNLKAILTAPPRIRLVVVKVETNEPGLSGFEGMVPCTPSQGGHP